MKYRNQALIVLVTIIASIYIIFFINLNDQNVLSLLESELKYCEIIKTNGEKFWLICNGRPFYAEYDGELKYEMNGWSFLKETEYWGELEECNLYSYDNLIGFLCIPSLEDAKIKYFEFDRDSFSLEKSYESDFYDIAKEDLSSVYPFLEDCSINDYSADIKGLLERGSYMSLTFSCDDKIYDVKLNLEVVFPPGTFNNLNEDEKKDMFFKSFNKEGTIEDGFVYGNFDFGRFGIKYGDDMGGPLFKTEADSIFNVVNDIGLKFIPCLKNSDTRLIKEETILDPDISGRKYWFRTDSCGIIKAYLIEDGILAFERIHEGFYG